MTVLLLPAGALALAFGCASIASRRDLTAWSAIGCMLAMLGLAATCVVGLVAIGPLTGYLGYTVAALTTAVALPFALTGIFRGYRARDSVLLSTVAMVIAIATLTAAVGRAGYLGAHIARRGPLVQVVQVAEMLLPRNDRGEPRQGDEPRPGEAASGTN